MESKIRHPCSKRKNLNIIWSSVLLEQAREFFRTWFDTKGFCVCNLYRLQAFSLQAFQVDKIPKPPPVPSSTETDPTSTTDSYPASDSTSGSTSTPTSTPVSQRQLQLQLQFLRRDQLRRNKNQNSIWLFSIDSIESKQTQGDPFQKQVTSTLSGKIEIWSNLQNLTIQPEECHVHRPGCFPLIFYRLHALGPLVLIWKSGG